MVLVKNREDQADEALVQELVGALCAHVCGRASVRGAVGGDSAQTYGGGQHGDVRVRVIPAYDARDDARGSACALGVLRGNRELLWGRLHLPPTKSRECRRGERPRNAYRTLSRRRSLRLCGATLQTVHTSSPSGPYDVSPARSPMISSCSLVSACESMHRYASWLTSTRVSSIAIAAGGKRCAQARRGPAASRYGQTLARVCSRAV